MVQETGDKKEMVVMKEVPLKEVDWKPVTALGKLVKEGKISSIEEVFAS